MWVSSEQISAATSPEWAWDPSLYAGSARFYAAGRVAYPAEIVDVLVAALGLDGSGLLGSSGEVPDRKHALASDQRRAQPVRSRRRPRPRTWDAGRLRRRRLRSRPRRSGRGVDRHRLRNAPGESEGDLAVGHPVSARQPAPLCFAVGARPPHGRETALKTTVLQRRLLEKRLRVAACRERSAIVWIVPHHGGDHLRPVVLATRPGGEILELAVAGTTACGRTRPGPVREGSTALSLGVGRIL